MLGAAGFGRAIGAVALVLGAAGVASAVVLLADPGSPVAVVGVFALIGFHLVAGWRAYLLARV
jgi:hypothetical protein